VGLEAYGIISAEGDVTTEFIRDVVIQGDITLQQALTCQDELSIAGALTVTALEDPSGPGTYNIPIKIDDISTEGYFYFVVPVSGFITRVRTVISGAITIADAVVSLCLPVDVAAGDVIAASTTVTIATAASAAGDCDDSGALDYTDLNDKLVGSVSAGDLRALYTNGGSTDAAAAYCIIEISRNPW